MTATDHRMTIDARNLSCQGLQNIDPDGEPITFHGDPVIGYHAEMARRGEDHVFGCELIGHRAEAEPMTAEQLAEIEARAAGLFEYVTLPSEADQLAGVDVPALLAEVKRLEQELSETTDTLAVEQDVASRLRDRVHALEQEKARNVWNRLAEAEADRDRAREIAVALEQEQANAWIVPKVALDDNPYVRPRILGNGLIRRDSGDSTPEHTRRFVAQCLAAVDEAETQAKETDRA